MKRSRLSRSAHKVKAERLVKQSSNKKTAYKLYDMMFDRIRSNAGYGCETEYNVGVSRIAEALHCVFGAAAKSIGTGYSEAGHIDEEISELEKCVDEYDRSIEQYNVNNTKKTLENAKRVIAETERIDSVLKTLRPENKQQEVNKRMLEMSNALLRRASDEIISNPKSKPFVHLKPYVQEMRAYFETDYLPAFGETRITSA